MSLGAIFVGRDTLSRAPAVVMAVYNLPPLIRTPLIRNPPLGGKTIVTINLDGGTISLLIRTPPSEANIVTINLDVGTINLDGGGGSYWGGSGGSLIRGGDYTCAYTCMYI